MSHDKHAAEDGDSGSPSQSHSPGPKITSLPWWSIIAAGFGNVAHFYSICSLFSYAGIMSADLGWAADRDHAGNIAGFLQTANVLGRIPTSSLWGYFADRYGLKCGLCISMGSLALGNFLFGLCTGSVTTAVAVRFVFLGMCSGWVAMVGPLAMALGGPEKQTEVLGKIFASGTFITLLGPAVGGWTYGIVPHFPAAIPGALGGVLSLTALCAMWRWMEASENKSTTQQASKPSDLRTIDLVCTNRLPLCILLRSLQGCMNFSFFEVIPLWAISSLELGGLAMSEDELGIVLAASGAGSGLFAFFAMSRITSRFGLRVPIAIASIVVSVGFVLVPLLPGAVTLVVLHAIINSSYCLMAAGYISCLNNLAPTEGRSRVNGISVTFESIGKGLAPVVSSVCFASSLSLWGRTGHLVVYLFMASMHVLLAFGTLLLPRTLETHNHSGKASNLPVTRPSISAPVPLTVGKESSRCTLEHAPETLACDAEKCNVASKERGLEQDEEDGLMDADVSSAH